MAGLLSQPRACPAALALSSVIPGAGKEVAVNAAAVYPEYVSAAMCHVVERENLFPPSFLCDSGDLSSWGLVGEARTGRALDASLAKVVHLVLPPRVVRG